jgi:hypothetical protein
VSAIILDNEAAAWAVLERCLDNHGAAPRVRFDGWPYLEVTIRPGDGTITPEIRRAIALFENGIYRAFALNHYGSPDLRHLTARDRKQLAPETLVLPGSTKLIFDLARAATYFLRSTPNNMSGSQQLVATLGLGLLAFSGAAWLSWLYFNADVRKTEALVQGQTELAMIHLEMTKEQTDQMRLLSRAYEHDPSNTLQYAATDYVPWRPALLEMAHKTGTVSIGKFTLDNQSARAIAKTAKVKASKQRKKIARKSPPVIESEWVTEVVHARQLPAPPMRLGAV